MPNYHNIERSGLPNTHYIGYGPNGVWRIRREGRLWIGTEQNWPSRSKRATTLRVMSEHLAKLPRVEHN